jgi:hypothetical protein
MLLFALSPWILFNVFTSPALPARWVMPRDAVPAVD